jgi:phage baseplate assembly protein W
LVQTRFYEKKFHHNIGSNAAGLLFEPLTALTANAIKKEIENVLDNYEDRVTIKYISVTVNNEEDGYDVRLEFFINNQVTPVGITTFLERVK